ncbi:hypothetical protein P872_15135 [Rhodonellum psychrophilum GCM71 = DSM 17998]|uniref:WG repeat-containing protein n=2 Tax=Rhodonellum TaxID=336827 RepID=U5C873_9BACT|nr:MULTISPECIES: WG repeat-containing protein [Rhodonellum]ERM84377.1 hypothetical protein P872_15135 [Rhodonellum psychrophilum GCM71 = DSM 17998]SDZ42448.1 WG containing repeat-containing protein [Rhodonellum ikkaensis]
MNIYPFLKTGLLATGFTILTSLSFAQSWEVYDQNFQLTSRIEFDHISILGESVRISSMGNELNLLGKDYRSFLNLKGESVYQYLEPWIIVKGPKGLGAFHEYGEEVFPLEYDDIQIFYTKLLAQKGNAFWVYDRVKKSTVSIGTFDQALLAKNGQVIAQNEKGFFLPLSKNPGKVFKKLLEVNENFLISDEDTGFGLINREGEYILEPIIDELIHLEENYFYAFDGKQYMLIKAREERADIKYTSYHKITLGQNNMMLEYIHGKLRRVMDNEGILLDQTGMEKVTQVGYKKYNVYLRDKSVGLLGEGGWLVNPVLNLETILPGKENLYGAKKEGKYGFINKSGQMLIENRFDEISVFSEGLAAVKRNGLWGFVNKADQIIVTPQFEEVLDFHNGLSVVKQNGKSNLIDKNGGVLLGNWYSRISIAPDNYFITEENGLFGLIDASGLEIVGPKFNELRRETQDKIVVKMGDKFGVMDESGNYSLPIYYKNIIFDQGTNKILVEDRYQFMPAAAVEKEIKKKRGV